MDKGGGVVGVFGGGGVVGGVSVINMMIVDIL